MNADNNHRIVWIKNGKKIVEKIWQTEVINEIISTNTKDILTTNYWNIKNEENIPILRFKAVWIWYRQIRAFCKP